MTDSLPADVQRVLSAARDLVKLRDLERAAQLAGQASSDAQPLAAPVHAMFTAARCNLDDAVHALGGES